MSTTPQEQQGYRMLKVGETIQEGDSYEDGTLVGTFIGQQWDEDSFPPMRRPISPTPQPPKPTSPEARYNNAWHKLKGTPEPASMEAEALCLYYAVISCSVVERAKQTILAFITRITAQLGALLTSQDALIDHIASGNSVDPIADCVAFLRNRIGCPFVPKADYDALERDLATATTLAETHRQSGAEAEAERDRLAAEVAKLKREREALHKANKLLAEIIARLNDELLAARKDQP